MFRDALPRRGFLGRAAALAAAVTAAPRVVAAAAPSLELEDEWLDRLTGKHRQIFDMPQPADGLPLVHMLNYIQTYNTAYNVPDSEVNAVGTFYGMTTLHGVNDAMWAKYRIGEALGIADPATGRPAVRNPWRTEVHALGMTIAPAGIEALQRRGALFLLCNNALTFFAGQLAQAAGAQPTAVYEELRANMLPGVVLVPAMVIAIEKAQGRGVAYRRE
jgi:intracellular sulfur oxidation DsrE/DsrF family protein